MNIDFHSHSTCSDGVLDPADLAARAAAHGVTHWALTDHDDLRGIAAARQAADQLGLVYVTGVEISIAWHDVPIHIVGLNFDEQHPALVNGLADIRHGRVERARRMGDELARCGIGGVFDGAVRLSKNPELISRAHFARYMVSIGIARNTSSVFQRFLVAGKPGYVDHRWPTLEEAVSWLHAAGGIAIIAHPRRYKISAAQMEHLLNDFKDLGGEGLEVCSGSHKPEHVRLYDGLARRYGFYASRGSDFHHPEENNCDLGRAPAFPEGADNVWQLMQKQSAAHEACAV